VSPCTRRSFSDYSTLRMPFSWPSRPTAVTFGRCPKANGASEMRLDVWEFAAGPLEFYERLGYRTLRRALVREI
jgi:hypothetical protein